MMNWHSDWYVSFFQFRVTRIEVLSFLKMFLDWISPRVKGWDKTYATDIRVWWLFFPDIFAVTPARNTLSDLSWRGTWAALLFQSRIVRVIWGGGVRTTRLHCDFSGQEAWLTVLTQEVCGHRAQACWVYFSPHKMLLITQRNIYIFLFCY